MVSNGSEKPTLAHGDSGPVQRGIDPDTLAPMPVEALRYIFKEMGQGFVTAVAEMAASRGYADIVIVS